MNNLHFGCLFLLPRISNMSHYTDEEVNAFWADVEYVESVSLEKGWYVDNVLSDLIEERERRKIEGMGVT